MDLYSLLNVLGNGHTVGIFFSILTFVFLKYFSYTGEDENIASQNRYCYTINNPYKYVDPDLSAKTCVYSSLLSNK